MLNEMKLEILTKSNSIQQLKTRLQRLIWEDKVYAVVVLALWLLSVNYDIINRRTDNNSL